MRRLVLLAVACAAILYWRRRPTAEYAEVTFDDGSAVRFERGSEAGHLLGDARELRRILAG